ncbi:hypothetical protein E4U57_007212 [Claviceps arundinis]|uniref:Uncharacterized protein n=1 Tax=Claviceps arundinis TaxID=1623583 RepID=A0A9P7SNW8_9HYPO|nr:hypothetical protein E4U57_007212 [Claviceps arundinis]KAG5969465.1 hypothetical protein E4U56_008292 [Claviceps arundinis]
MASNLAEAQFVLHGTAALSKPENTQAAMELVKFDVGKVAIRSTLRRIGFSQYAAYRNPRPLEKIGKRVFTLFVPRPCRNHLAEW